MNSVKNLLVVVLLMGVSYGAFQVVNQPDPAMSDDIPEIEELDIQIGTESDDDPEALSGELAFAEPRHESPEPPPALPPHLHIAPAPENASAGMDAGIDDSVVEDIPDRVPDLMPDLNASVLPSAPPAPAGSSAPGASGDFQPATQLQPIEPKPETRVVTTPAPFNPPSAQSAATGASERGLSGSGFEPDPDEGSMSAPPADSSNGLASAARTAANGVAPPSDQPMFPAAPPAEPIDWTGINDMVEGGAFRDALATLSRYYDASLMAEDRMRMLQWLDQLAGKVIYSTEHLLEPLPYVVAEGDTLETLAADWGVPPQLISNINHSKIGDPTALVAGTELKVVRGPFHARVSIERQELTLFLNGMYAGRFPIELGQDHEYELGSFQIQAKSSTGHDYLDSSGQVIVAGDATNPYGRYWLSLGNSDLCLHESATPADQRGCLRLASRDAEDLYGILSEGSQVTIMR
jgi:hypothetical protein